MDQAELNKLLADVKQALDDWIVTYASECFRKPQVRAAQKRIAKNGGTLAYITALRERVNDAHNDQAEPRGTKGQP